MKTSIGIVTCGMDMCGLQAGVYTNLSIIATTVAMILLLLLVVKCITADDSKPSKKEPEQPLTQNQSEPQDENETLFCPRCGWQHPAEQKVCKNPRCNIRF